MKTPDPDRLAALEQRAARLGELKDHPSWADVRALFDARKEKHLRDFARDIMARQAITAEVLQRELDYTAGFWDGAEWILANPEQAENSFRAAFKRAERHGTLTEEN